MYNVLSHREMREEMLRLAFMNSPYKPCDLGGKRVWYTCKAPPSVVFSSRASWSVNGFFIYLKKRRKCTHLIYSLPRTILRAVV